MPLSPADPQFDARIRQSFAAQGMLGTLKAEVVATGPGRCDVAAPICPETSQQHGYAHAGLSFTLGDVACGYAALSLLPADQEVLTSEMKIHLLAPAKGERLEARGEVLRAGRRQIVCRADVFAIGEDGAETHCATLLGTIVAVRKG